MYFAGLIIVAAMVLLAIPAGAQPAQGAPAPALKGVDIREQEVDLTRLLQDEPDLVILLFFTIDSGEELAAKLKEMDQRDRLLVIAVGLKDEEDALRAFADKHNIYYHIIKDTPELDADGRYGPLPGTARSPSLSRTIVGWSRSSGAGGSSLANVITRIAEVYLQQGKPEEAREVAAQALAAQEPEAEARSVVGHAYLREGQPDQAEAEFTKVDDKAGLARVGRGARAARSIKRWPSRMRPARTTAMPKP